MQELIVQLYKTTWIEIIAVITGLFFPIFAAYEKKIGWLFAGISSVFYCWIFFEGRLYQDAILNLFYVIMAVVGYLMWKGYLKFNKKLVVISKLGLKANILFVFFGLVFTFISGYLFKTYTNADYPYIDAFVTGFSFIATWLDARKKIENWYLFLLADGVGAWLFYQKGYLLTSILYIIFCFICILGIIQWRKRIKFIKRPFSKK